MKKEELKTEIIKAIGQEIDQWLDESEKITSGYEYEDQFLIRMRNMSKIIMQKSIGETGTNRNKKNSILA